MTASARLLLGERAGRGRRAATPTHIPRLACDIGSGVVRGFRFGQTILEIDTGVVRRHPPGFHGPSHLLLFRLDRVARGIDLFFDPAPRVLKGVSDGFRHVRCDALRRVARLPRTTAKVRPRLGAGARRKQQGEPSANRRPENERAHAAAAVLPFDDDVAAIFVVEVVLMMTHSGSVQRFFVVVFFAVGKGVFGAATGLLPLTAAPFSAGAPSISEVNSFRTSSCPTPSNLAVRDRSPPVAATVCKNMRLRPSENDAPTGLLTVP